MIFYQGVNTMNERLKFAMKQRKKYPEKPFIHPSVTIPKWVTVGNNVTIREGCTIGTQGFGFENDENGEFFHIPHTGGVTIGDNVEIFEGVSIARGTIDNTIIGDGTKIDCHVHIGHNAKIGKNCIITAGAIFSGSTVLGDNCFVGIGACIKDHVFIANRVLIGQGANVVSDISKENVVVVGNPAQILRDRNEL